MSVFLFTQAYFIYSVPILVGLMLCTIESLFLLRGKSFFGLLDMPQQFGQPELTPYHVVPHILKLYEVTIVFWLMVFFYHFWHQRHADPALVLCLLAGLCPPGHIVPCIADNGSHCYCGGYSPSGATFTQLQQPACKSRIPGALLLSWATASFSATKFMRRSLIITTSCRILLFGQWRPASDC